MPRGINTSRRRHIELVTSYLRNWKDSPSFPSLDLHHSSFSNTSVASPTSQLILQPFFRFTYVTAFFKLSVALPTSQLFLQAFSYFTYVTAHSPILLSLLLRHRLFTYVTWRAANNSNTQKRKVELCKLVYTEGDCWCINHKYHKNTASYGDQQNNDYNFVNRKEPLHVTRGLFGFRYKTSPDLSVIVASQQATL